MSELHKRCQGGMSLIDIEAWYSFTAFDIIGELPGFSCFRMAGNNTDPNAHI